MARLLILQESISYQEAWHMQQALWSKRVSDQQPDTLLLLQHHPVFTLGRSTLARHLPYGESTLRDCGAAVERTNRGGSITYHGPGQLVGYPIIKLARVASGPRIYVWLLEEMLIRTLTLWGIAGHRLSRKPGVFVLVENRECKIASIGIRLDRGVSLHGFALNVDLDLRPFSNIIPCGLEDCPAISMRAIHRGPISLPQVAESVADIFANLFQVVWEDRQFHPSNPISVGLLAASIKED
jgi:lipoate-protein ligase B